MKEISARQNISLAYLEQLFILLKEKKLVRSSRGSYGGYVLEKPASEINLSNIIYAVNEEVKTLNCKKDSKKDVTINQENALLITYGIS